MNCDTCFGAGTIASGRHDSCAQCGGRGYGGDVNTPCMGCGGTGQGTSEIRETCWNCGGAGSLPDPTGSQRSSPRAATASVPPPKGAGSTGAPPVARSGAPSGPIAALSLLGGLAYGGITYSNESEIQPALIAGAIVFVGGLVGLHLLYGAVKMLLQAMKVAIPIAGLLVIGNLLEWQWAVGATDRLAGFWGGAVEAAEKAWTEYRAD